jgi:hypothetical protein
MTPIIVAYWACLILSKIEYLRYDLTNDKSARMFGGIWLIFALITLIAQVFGFAAGVRT